MDVFKYNGENGIRDKAYYFVKNQCKINNKNFSSNDEKEFSIDTFNNMYFTSQTGFWIISENDTIVGSIGLTQLEVNVGELRRFYILEKYQNQKIGQHFLNIVQKFISQKSYNCIRCVTDSQSQACIHLLLNNGFVSISPYRQSRGEFFYEKSFKDNYLSCNKLSEKLCDSLITQESLFKKSLILNPVENVPFSDSLFPATSFLHGLYNTDSIRAEEQKISTKIQFAGRDIITEDIKEIYKVWSNILSAEDVSMRLLSGLHAHTVLFMSVSSPGDKVLLLPEEGGGHFSTKKILERLGLTVKELPVDYTNKRIDKTQSLQLINDFKPNFIFIDRSEGLIYEDFSWLSCNSSAYKIFDTSQYLTNIISMDYLNPFNMGFDLLLSTTHKNFPGPQMALIATKRNDDMWKRIKKGISTYVSNMHVFNIYSAGIMLRHYNELKLLSSRMLTNTKMLDNYLKKLGVLIVQRNYNNFIEPITHHIWIDLQTPENAYLYFKKLSHAGINTNYRKLPYKIGYGLRLGLSGATRLGLKEEKDIKCLSEYIYSILNDIPLSSEEVSSFIESIRNDVQ